MAEERELPDLPDNSEQLPITDEHLRQIIASYNIYGELIAEREAQDAKFGSQIHLPNGTGSPSSSHRWTFDADVQKNVTDFRADAGKLGWSDILAEEVAEAFAEDDPVKLRAELIQVAAVALAWLESIDAKKFHEELQGD